jgi:hypothetical protein
MPSQAGSGPQVACFASPGDLHFTWNRPETWAFRSRAGLPSPSCHIYNPLTIAVAFRGLLAFDWVWQHPIKVDGTFA